MSARFVSTREAGQLLRLSEDAVRRRIASGEIAAVRVGWLWRVRLDRLAAGWVARDGHGTGEAA